MIESFRLPFIFETTELRAELNHLSKTEWLPHFNTSNYTGNWSGIALRAPDGNEKSIYPSPDSKNKFQDTRLLSLFPSVQKILMTFECKITSVRFLVLEKGAVIKEHFDNALSFEEGDARLHIPIQTNELVEFISNGKRLQMAEGECWYINASLPHSVANQGETDRIHLVLDCIVNDWLRNFFKNEKDHPVTNNSIFNSYQTEASDDGLESIRTEKDLENMIKALHEIGTQTALEMIAKLTDKQKTNAKKNDG
jgi:hypothetical protein